MPIIDAYRKRIERYKEEELAIKTINIAIGAIALIIFCNWCVIMSLYVPFIIQTVLQNWSK